MQWSMNVRFGPAINIDRLEKITVILLNHKRPWNMEMIVRSLLKCTFVEKIILCNNGAEEPVCPQHSNPRIQIITLPYNGKPIHRFVLAQQESSDFFLFIDDDIFLSPKQIKNVFFSLIKDPSHVHGVCGERISPEKFEHYLHGCDMELSILSRVYACGREHIARFFTLVGMLGQEHLAIAPFRDDILLSMSGREKPLCHDIGSLLSCPSCAKKGIAVFRDDRFTNEARLSFYRHLQAMRASECISDADVEHLHGAASVECANDEIIVTCLMKNAELTITSFIEHYFSLGVRHIFLLDNGSTDQTIERASKYDNVSVFRCTLPFNECQLPMKRWLARRFCTNCWCLCVDVDELFLYPNAEQLSLQSFLRYLNHHKYTAVVAHMLDMFADEKLSDLESNPNDSLRGKYPFYDLSNIQTLKQEKQFQLTSNRKITCFYGGIRKTLFGSDHFLLTKMPLFFVNEAIKIFPNIEHFVEDAEIADITGVLLHYKFLGNFKKYTCHAVEGGYHWNNSAEYKLYASALEKQPDLSLMSEAAEKWQSTSALVQAGYLEESQRYGEYVRKKSVLYTKG